MTHRSNCTASLRVLLLVLLSVASPTHVSAAQDQYFDSDGVEIRYTIQGGGPPVILLHGFTGNYEAYWARVTETLRPHFQVIGVDARGHGKSGKPDDPDAYGVQMVKDVANLLDHLGIEKAHVAGYSMGGYVALKMASIYPDRLLSAVSGGQGMINNEDLGRFVPRYHAGLQRWIDEQVPFGPWGELDNDPKALQHALNSFQLMTISPGDASALHVPVLAIHGSLDDRGGSTNRLKAAQPAVEVIVIDGEGHMSTFNAEAFSSALLNWFRGVGGG